MMLTIQISDESLSLLKDTLRIRKEDMDHVASIESTESNVLHSYAWRILCARRTLNLSNSTSECCYDYSGPKTGVLLCDPCTA